MIVSTNLQSSLILLKDFLGADAAPCAGDAGGFGEHRGAPEPATGGRLVIVEPWAHVGVNENRERVRASANLVALMETIAAVPCEIFPIWQTGLGPLAGRGVQDRLGIVIEGGNPSAFAPESFAGAAYEADDLITWLEGLLLSRWSMLGPVIGICLGHQLLACALVQMVRRACAELSQYESAASAHAAMMTDLHHVSQTIRTVGEDLTVCKRDGREAARGWAAAKFCVSRNELPELGEVRLQPYDLSSRAEIPQELLACHRDVASALDGVIDMRLESERNIAIAMFHGDEVNEVAMLFVNWALQGIYRVATRHQVALAQSHLRWVLEMPYAVEIVASTWYRGVPLTECAAMAIHYLDHTSQRHRRSYSMQFHPELQADLRDVTKRPRPTYQTLRRDEGARLLAKMLCGTAR